MYKTRNFKLQELVHPQIIKDIGEVNSWMRLDEGCLRDLDIIRDQWGSPIYCNRISSGIDSRGLRPPNDPDGSFYSTHKSGKAFDLEPKNGDHLGFYDMVHKMIVNGLLFHFNVMEDPAFTPTWCHVAKMNVSSKPFVIKP